MSLASDLKSRKPAKALADVDIPDASWKADFDIVDRYQSFANELLRIALLGIAGYGFLVHKLGVDKEKFKPILSETSIYLCVGVGFLILSIIFVLAYRFYSTTCLFCQVQIMRSLKRLENGHWTPEDKHNEILFLKIIRTRQRDASVRSDKILKASAVAFGLGFVFVLFVFYQFLKAIES